MKHRLDLDFWQHKSILILGFGREGRAAYRFLRSQFPERKLGIADKLESIDIQNDKNTDLHLGLDYLSAITHYDVVIKSPGVALPDLSREELNKIVAPTDIFLCLFGHHTIGVTGTKGKSTTASLIHFLLKSTGKKTILLGNIGLPALDYVDQIEEDTLIVFELSAHQLEFVQHSPHISLLLNIFPEHLDYFKDFDSYKEAKYNIFRYQKTGDFAFCVQQGLICENGLPIEDPETELRQLTNGRYSFETLRASTQLKGRHNLANIVAALKVIESVGIPVLDAIDQLKNFKPLPHRLEFVGEYGGIQFYNDSISTVPQSTIEAVKTLPEVNAIILGGFDRGLDYSGLTKFLVESRITYFFFLGRAGQRMYDMMKQNNKCHYFRVNDLNEVFQILRNTKEIKACLLSPAASSYDQFRNFEHRGDHFKELAHGFKRK